MTINDFKETGLTSEQAKNRLQQYGKNVLAVQKKENFFIKILTLYNCVVDR